MTDNTENTNDTSKTPFDTAAYSKMMEEMAGTPTPAQTQDETTDVE